MAERVRSAIGAGARTLVLALLLLFPAAARALPLPSADDRSLCGAETARQEKLQGIPDRLLHAISLVESGRWDSERRESFAWPWTVMAEGRGRFLTSKAAAIAEVQQLQARGVRNIDVGCMQVNLHAHRTAFQSLDEAFEPATNVAYAARFLMGLYSSTQNWGTAGAYYHSQTPSEAAPYKAKLLSVWESAKGRSDDRLYYALWEGGSDNQPPAGLLAGPPLPAPAASASGSRRHGAAASAGTSHTLPGRAGQQTAQATENRTAAEREEARRIAEAYRQARLEEYRLRKLQQGNRGPTNHG